MFLKRFTTTSCWDTFLFTLAICLSNFSLLSIVTPRRVRSSLTGIVLSQWNFGFRVCNLPMTIAWYFEWFRFFPFASYHRSTAAKSVLIISAVCLVLSQRRKYECRQRRWISCSFLLRKIGHSFVTWYSVEIFPFGLTKKYSFHLTYYTWLFWNSREMVI